MTRAKGSVRHLVGINLHFPEPYLQKDQQKAGGKPAGTGRKPANQLLGRVKTSIPILPRKRGKERRKKERKTERQRETKKEGKKERKKEKERCKKERKKERKIDSKKDR